MILRGHRQPGGRDERSSESEVADPVEGGGAAGFAPVTDLAALNEFRGKEQHALVKKLSLVNQADQLAGRSVCLVIGDQDQRVGTKHAIDLATRLTAASLKKQVPSRGLSDEGKSLKKAIGHCETTEWTVVSY